MQSFFTSKFYFIFCLGLGFFSLYFLGPTPQATTETTQFSSYAPLQLNEFETLADAEVIAEFEVSANDLRTRARESDYILSYDQLEEFEQRLDAPPKESSQLPNFAGGDVYENVADCTGESLEIEKSLNDSPAVADLIKERSEVNEMSRGCVAYVMTKMRNDLPATSRARCKSSSSEPEREGPPVCLTKAMVNITYNTYLDVARCLELDPRNLLPKLFNESGFLVNTLGPGGDAGVGQFTTSAIDEVNNRYASNLIDMQTRAKTNEACARVMKHKTLLAPVAKEITSRCGLVVTPENPLKSMVYMGILNKLNIKMATSLFKANDIMGKMEKLGLRNINEDQLVEIMAMLGYNTGVGTAVKVLNKYLDARMSAGLKLSDSDFDFHHSPKLKELMAKRDRNFSAFFDFSNSPLIAADFEKKDRDAYEQGKNPVDLNSFARSFVYATIIKDTDAPEVKALKAQKIKMLPRQIKESYKMPFAVFIVYNVNNFDGVSNSIDSHFKIPGAPGYLTYLAQNDAKIKQEFAGKNMNCSNPNFLKVK